VIRVNDRLELAWHEGTTVRDVLDQCGFTYPLLVVSINGSVVTKEAYDRASVADGDEIRVLHLMAGG